MIRSQIFDAAAAGVKFTLSTPKMRSNSVRGAAREILGGRSDLEPPTTAIKRLFTLPLTFAVEAK